MIHIIAKYLLPQNPVGFEMWNRRSACFFNRQAGSLRYFGQIQPDFAAIAKYCHAAVVACALSVIPSVVSGADTVLYGDAAFMPTSERVAGWWGENVSGRFPGAKGFPLEWDSRTGKNIIWVTDVEDWGHSSPVIAGDRMFFQSDGGDHIICLALDDGRVLWRRDMNLGYLRPNTTHHWKHGWNFTTPATDGRLVYAWWPKGAFTAYDFDGNTAWSITLPPHYENNALPCVNVVLAGNVIVLRHGTGHNRLEFPPRQPQMTTGYDITDGTKLWKNTTVRPASWNYQTLVPLKLGGEWVVIDWRGNVMRASDGELLAGPPEENMRGSHVAAVYGDKLVVSHTFSPSARSGLPRNARRFLNCRIIPGNPWRIEQVADPVVIRDFGDDGTTLFDGEYVYVCGERAVLAAYNFHTGRIVSPGGIEGMPLPKPDDMRSLGSVYSRILRAGDYLYAATMQGAHFILSTAPEIRVLAVNRTRIGTSDPGSYRDSTLSTPVFHGNRIFIRHSNLIFCIGDTEEEEHNRLFEQAAAAESADAYRPLLTSARLHVRYRAVQEMTAKLGDDAADELFALFKAEDPHMRRLAIRHARTLQGENSIAVFTGGLKEPDPLIRRTSLALLGEMRATAGTADIVACLKDADESIQAAAVRALGMIGGEHAVKALVEYIADADENMEALVIDALSFMPDRNSSVLAAYTTRATGRAKACLFHAIAQRSDAGDWKKAAGEALRDADTGVRIAALGIFQASGTINDLGLLLKALETDINDEFAAALESTMTAILASSGDHEGYTRVLLDGLEDAAPHVRRSVIRALGPAGGAAARTAVDRAWNDSRPEIRAAALDAFAAWPSTDILDRLFAIAGEPDRLDAAQRDILAGALLHMDDLHINADDDVRLRKISAAMSLTRSQDLRSNGLERLTDIPTVESLNIAGIYVDSTPAGMIAADAIIELAPAFTESHPQRALDALRALVREVRDRGYRNDAQKAIDEIEKKRTSFDDLMMDGLGL